MDNTSTIRADVFTGPDSVQMLASITVQGGLETPNSFAWTLIDQRYFNEGGQEFTPLPGQTCDFILTWNQPQTISRVQIYASGLGWSYWNLDLLCKSPGESVWKPLNPNWQKDLTFPPRATLVTFSTSFPIITVSAIRIPFSYGNAPYDKRRMSFAEIGVFKPKPLEITSPANGAQFVVGENIQFTSQANENLMTYQWFADGVVFGNTPGDPSNSASYLSPGTHTITLTAFRASDRSPVSDSITIEILAGFKIKNLDATPGLDPFSTSVSVSYRAAKTRFQAIGLRIDDTESGPTPVDWEIQGGEVVATEQLRMGILSHLGQVNTRIGNIENSPIPVPGGQIIPILDTPQVTFHSFLPGNITLAAKKGTSLSSVAIRIKQPTFKVKVYPVEGVDVVGIFDIWKGVVDAVWNKENVMHVESVDLLPGISNVTYPDSPLGPPLQGAEESMIRFQHKNPSYLNPLVFDYLLGQNSGLYIVPRQSYFLFSQRDLPSINVYVVRKPLIYYEDHFVSPTEEIWRYPNVAAISSRDYILNLANSGVVLRGFPAPYPPEYQKFLAQGIGRILGLPQYVEWLTNLMDFGPTGGLIVNPVQYITALNYNGDNPQSSFFISEQ